MQGPDWLDAAATAGSLQWQASVSSWLGPDWLGDVPISRGTVTWSTRSEVPGVLNLTVPRYAGGTDWGPGRDARHPLARFGQELAVTVTVTSPVSGRAWTRRLGRFLIEKAETGGGVVAVRARSLMARLEEDRLITPTPTRPGGTLASEARRLVPSRVGIVIDPALTDRPAPAMTWGESRIESLQEIAKAWPARLRETSDGQVALLPPLADDPTPILTLTDGESGTVVEAPRTSTREGAYNRLVVRGTDRDEAGRPTIQAVADHTDGPMGITSHYGVVTMFHASPLITTVVSAQRTAQTMLADSVRPSTTLPVTLAPDLRLDMDDPVRVVTADGSDVGLISGITTPLTVGDRDMRIDVEVGA